MTKPTLPALPRRHPRHARRSFLNRYADAILFLWSCLLIAALIILALT